MADVTDIAGIRIICYFAADVDRIGKMVEAEFAVDTENSVDKRALLDPDRFGYLSLHHVINLGTSRTLLREYRRFAGMSAEVQTRSLLQHAWAEIEHDLGYKATFAIPDVVRRRFTRVAGLLELADQEFGDIRAAMSAYQRKLPRRIARMPETVTIDQDSIRLFISTDPLVAELDAQIAEQRGAIVSQLLGATATFAAERLRLVGLSTIADVASALRLHRDEVIKLATAWLRRSGPSETLSRGVSVFYLAYVIVLVPGDEDRVRSFMANAHLSSAADELLGVWRERGA